MVLSNMWLCSVSFSRWQSGVWVAPGGPVVGPELHVTARWFLVPCRFPTLFCVDLVTYCLVENVWGAARLALSRGAIGISFACGFYHVGVVGMALCDSDDLQEPQTICRQSLCFISRVPMRCTRKFLPSPARHLSQRSLRVKSRVEVPSGSGGPNSLASEHYGST